MGKCLQRYSAALLFYYNVNVYIYGYEWKKLSQTTLFVYGSGKLLVFADFGGSEMVQQGLQLVIPPA